MNFRGNFWGQERPRNVERVLGTEKNIPQQGGEGAGFC